MTRSRLVERSVRTALGACILTGGILLAGCPKGSRQTPEVKTWAQQLHDILEAQERFKADMGRYPTEKEGVHALLKKPDSPDADRWKGPYLAEESAKDQWGHYAYYGPVFEKAENAITMAWWSVGPDGIPYTADDIDELRRDRFAPPSEGRPAQAPPMP